MSMKTEILKALTEFILMILLLVITVILHINDTCTITFSMVSCFITLDLYSYLYIAHRTMTSKCGCHDCKINRKYIKDNGYNYIAIDILLLFIMSLTSIINSYIHLYLYKRDIFAIIGCVVFHIMNIILLYHSINKSLKIRNIFKSENEYK